MTPQETVIVVGGMLVAFLVPAIAIGWILSRGAEKRIDAGKSVIPAMQEITDAPSQGYIFTEETQADIPPDPSGKMTPERIADSHERGPAFLRGLGMLWVVTGVTQSLKYLDAFVAQGLEAGIFIPPEALLIAAGVVALSFKEPVILGMMALVNLLVITRQFLTNDFVIWNCVFVIFTGISIFLFVGAQGVDKRYARLPDELKLSPRQDRTPSFFPQLGFALALAAAFFWPMHSFTSGSMDLIPDFDLVPSLAVASAVSAFSICLPSLWVGHPRALLNIIGMLLSGPLVLVWLF